MKFIIAVIATIGFAIVTHLIFPWWAVVIAVALVAAGMGLQTGKSFMAGFIGLSVLWGTYAIFLNLGNGGVLAGRIGTLMQGQTPVVLIAVTSLLGGLLGGLAGLTGSLGRKLTD